LVLAISSAVDKLDKSTWEEVREGIEEKGLDDKVADKVSAYVVSLEERSFEETLEFVRSDTLLSQNKQVKNRVAEMEPLLRYLTAFDIAQYVKFDLSLARG
jgi:histidyl-tRNA synthetase